VDEFDWLVPGTDMYRVTSLHDDVPLPLNQNLDNKLSAECKQSGLLNLGPVT
jgi:hypothetical protein